MSVQTSFFHRFFEKLDGENAEEAMEYVADDMEFAILWAPDTEKRNVRQFIGGPDRSEAVRA